MKDNTYPHLFHIGTQKAGSTYFFNMLVGHPDIALSPMTEVEFFSKNYSRGYKWYQDSFPQAGIKIDTSPKYFMLASQVAPRIRQYGDKFLSVEPKFLLILRNPLTYLSSHYQMQKIQNPTPENKKLSLVQFVKKHPGYLERAKYYSKLKIWLEYFDLKQFKIICFEDFKDDINSYFKEILAFWELADYIPRAMPASANKGLRGRWAWQIRRQITKREGMKNYLKKSPVFNWVYDNILSTDSKKELSAPDSKYLSGELGADICELQKILPETINKWKL